jgi:hypothetical protein
VAFVTVNAVVGILVCRLSQREVRNIIFRVLNSDARLWTKIVLSNEEEQESLVKFRESSHKERTVYEKLRYFQAKTAATSFFLLAVFLSFFSPGLFIATIVINEIIAQAYPRSEHSDVIGAWGT